jgi:hypothetical protein
MAHSCLPLGLPALHFNSALLDQAGVSAPAADWSLDAFRAAAQRATGGSGPAQRYGFATTNGAFGLSVWLQQRGVLPVAERDGMLAPSFVTPQVQTAAQEYIDLLRTSSPHTRLSGYTRVPLPDESAGPRSQGRVAFWLEAQDRYGGTTMMSSTSKLAPLPRDPRALPVFTIALAGYISAQSQQPQACWQWLRFLSEQPDVLPGTYLARASLASGTTATVAGATAPEVYAAASLLAPAPGGPTSDVFDDPRIDLFWFYQEVDNAIQGKDLRQELSVAQRTTEAYLACVAGGAAGPACAKLVDPAYAGLQQTTKP